VFANGEIAPGVLASFVAATVSTAGLLSMAALGDWGRRNSSYFSAFAMGVLLVAVLFHLTPESLSYTPHAWRWIVGGFLLMSGIGLALRFLTSTGKNGHGFALGYASLIALGFHSTVDGLIYEATYHAEVFTGSLATAGLLLHEFPEGVIAYFLAREAGLNSLQSTFWAFVTSSVTTVAGALAAASYVESVTALPFGPMLGLTAGFLAYIMIFHLAPHASLTPYKRGYAVASFGVAIALAAVVIRHLYG